MEKNAIGDWRKTQNSAASQSNNGRHSTYTLVRREEGGGEERGERANERREIRYSNPSASGQS